MKNQFVNRKQVIPYGLDMIALPKRSKIYTSLSIQKKLIANTGSHKLAIEGSIGAREIKVEANEWSDFVFEKEYHLPSLKEVENYIKEKGHLKNIPSAEEVEENGIFLGEMNAKLLQKIEELTLYTISQEKKIQKVEKQNESLKFINLKLVELQKRLEKLENK